MDKFDETCRTCNTIRPNLLNLCSNIQQNDIVTYLDILCVVCPSLSVKVDDDLPQKICYFCSKQLEIAHNFQLQCQKSNEELWKIVKASIKEELAQSQTQEVEEESLKEETIYNDCDEISCLDDDFDDAIFTESPEFLDGDDEMQVLWDGEEQVTEERLELEDDTEEHNDKNTITSESVASFACNLCDKIFFTCNGLTMHLKLAHKNSKPLTEKTGYESKHVKLYKSGGELGPHSRSEHKNDSKAEHACHICRKTFLGKNRLDHHLLYHEKHRFKCKVKDCNRTFPVKYKLTDHMKRFHGIVLSPNQTKTLKPCLRIDST